MIEIGRNTACIIDLISLLHKAPRTRPELMELTEMSERAVRRWINALQGEGLIEVIGSRREKRGAGPASRIFGWVPAKTLAVV